MAGGLAVRVGAAAGLALPESGPERDVGVRAAETAADDRGPGDALAALCVAERPADVRLGPDDELMPAGGPAVGFTLAAGVTVVDGFADEAADGVVETVGLAPAGAASRSEPTPVIPATPTAPSRWASRRRRMRRADTLVSVLPSPPRRCSAGPPNSASLAAALVPGQAGSDRPYREGIDRGWIRRMSLAHEAPAPEPAISPRAIAAVTPIVEKVVVVAFIGSRPIWDTFGRLGLRGTSIQNDGRKITNLASVARSARPATFRATQRPRRPTSRPAGSRSVARWVVPG